VNDPPGIPTIYYDIVDADTSTPDVKENLTVRFFTEEVEDIDGDELSYSWDFDSSFGVHGNAKGLDILFTFPAPGNYTVTLTVSDSQPGGVQQVSERVEILEPSTTMVGEDGKTSSDGSPTEDEDDSGSDDGDVESTMDTDLSIIAIAIAIILIGLVLSLGIYLIRIRGTLERSPPHPYDTPRSDVYHGRRPRSSDTWDLSNDHDTYPDGDDPWEDEDFEVF